MARSGSSAGRRLLVVVVVLLLLAVIVDRVGVVIAEHVAATSIRDSQHLRSTPDVDVGGFPFLTQLASGSYDEIDVTAHDVPVSRTSDVLDLTTIRIELHHVDASRDFSTVHTRTARAAATIGYDELGRRLGVSLRYTGDGRVMATKSISLAGHALHGSVTVRPDLVDGALALVDRKATGSSTIGEAVLGALTKALGLTVPLRGIPFGIRAQSVRATAAGVTLVLTGADLTYSKSG